MLIVKFTSLNDYTLRNLINNEVYFSTVYQFNDFSEMRYIAPSNPPQESFGKIIEKHINQPNLCAKLIEGIKSNPFTTRLYITKLIKKISQKQPLNGNDRQVVLEHIAYDSVGIFSASDVSIFETIDCHLMAAHYGNSNKGVALIYECKKNQAHPITYPPLNSLDINISAGWMDRILAWAQHNYTDMEDFTVKNKVWEYEKEIRLFNTPGLHSTSEIDLELKTILYTPIFDAQNIKTLKKVNSEIYNDQINIMEIYPPADKTKPFRIEIDNQTHPSVHDWLRQLDKEQTA